MRRTKKSEAPAARARSEMHTLLSENDVTLEKLQSVFETACYTTEIDEDGGLKITDGALKAFAVVEPDKKMISFVSIWGLKPGVPEAKKLQFVNSLNDEIAFVRFSMPDPETLWCDYQFLYEGGITPYAIIRNYRFFDKVIRGVVATKDPDDIIGSE